MGWVRCDARRDFKPDIGGFVIPAQAGIQVLNCLLPINQALELDSRFRGNDGLSCQPAALAGSA